MRPLKLLTIIPLLATSTLALAASRDREVDARSLFDEGPSDPLRIEVRSPDVLVFDASGGDFVLQGRELVLNADIVELRGDVVLRSFPSTGDKETRAQDTPAGAEGSNGRSAAQMQLSIVELRTVEGATLTVINDGLDGAQGSPGTVGTPGTAGEDGRHRRCGRHARAPGDGGNGSRGGDGGRGGRGGDGGFAADIVLSPELCSRARDGHVTLSARGGQGGLGGLGGAGGAGGAGGRGGYRAWCGPAGEDGASGEAGRDGLAGPDGISRPDARVLQTNGHGCDS